ncbi:hypothetical protein [Plantactinospora sp. GCM10030261]|uniref:hypothetical protein n=1 Tax=Plantactinospora sp. GCM10030261 TaxID=3273420 RepID=UPI003616C176
MGTSTGLPTLGGVPWGSARRQLARWDRVSTGASTTGDEVTAPAQEDWVEQAAERCRQSLTDALRDDPDDLAGLRPSAVRAGERLVQALGELLDGRSPLVGVPGATAQERQDRFVAEFVNAVAGTGGLVSDAIARRAARRSAEGLLIEESPVTAALRTGSGGVRISGELFCTVYRLFFGEYVGEFIRTVIAEGMALAAPLALPGDPTGLVAGAVAKQVIQVLPDPCGATTGREPRKGLLATIAGELLTDVVDSALGIRKEEAPCPPASTPTNTPTGAG